MVPGIKLNRWESLSARPISSGLETNLLVAVKCSRGVGQGEELGGGSRGREQGGQGSPSRGSSPGSAPFPDSHLQGQDAVVPHKRLAVTTSFRSLSGFPATIKGHVCRREEGGGGKWPWRRDGVGSLTQGEGEGAPGAGGESPRPVISAVPSEPRGWIKQKAALLKAQLGEAEQRGESTSWGQSETPERRPFVQPKEVVPRHSAEAELEPWRLLAREAPGALLGPLCGPGQLSRTSCF